MKSFPLSYVGAIALAIVVLAVWFVPTPPATVSTYAAAVALLLGVGSVMLLTWRNALPVETIGQLLQRTEVEDSIGRRRRNLR